MSNTRDYSYIKPGYIFPVSNVLCCSNEYHRYDKTGHLRHYAIVKCPFCSKQEEQCLDRCEFNPKTQSGPRYWCCKECSKTHKRLWKDPWRYSINNNAAKQGINISRTEDLEGKIFGDLLVGPARDGYTDKFGLAWWPCKCLRCNDFEFVRGSGLTSSKTKLACKKCLGKISSGELTIIKWFKQHNIQYETQVNFTELRGLGDKPLSYDFGIKDKNNNFIYLIEFQGKQHYQPIEYFGGKEKFKIQQEHDNRKRQYCKEHNIKLIEIPYNYDNLDSYLNEILVN